MKNLIFILLFPILFTNLYSKQNPLLFERYTKLSVGVGGKQLFNNSDPIQSRGPVINIGLEHFLDTSQNWSLHINYFYMNIRNNELGEQVLVHFPTITLKYYLLNTNNDFNINLHAGSYLTFILLTWDLGGGWIYNIYNNKLYIENSIHYTNKFPLFLPNYRMPLIYKINLAYKF